MFFNNDYSLSYTQCFQMCSSALAHYDNMEEGYISSPPYRGSSFEVYSILLLSHSPSFTSVHFASVRFASDHFSSLHIRSLHIRSLQISTKKGFKRGGLPCTLLCVLLGRQCDMSTKKGFKRGGLLCTTLVCSARQAMKDRKAV